MRQIHYSVNYFRYLRRHPVEDFIKDQSQTTQATIYQCVDLLRMHGSHAGWPVVKKIEKGLFELRIRGSTQLRFIFVTYGADVMSLHGFMKKTQKLPVREIRLAKKRPTILSHM